MDAPACRYRWVFASLCLFLGLVPAGATEPLAAGQLFPLLVRDGQCDCVLPTPRPDEKFFLLVSSLACSPGPFPVTVRAEPVPGPAWVPVEAPLPDPAWQKNVHDLNLRLGRARALRGSDEFRPGAEPPRQRTFYLFTKEHDFQDAANYVPVVADLQAAGRFCQVYLDRAHGDSAGLRPTIDEIVQTFDHHVYPRACRELGWSLDVDRDGRFTILLTGWLGRLCNGKVSLGGFVRGSDFYRDLAAPHGNRCDMMYLNTDLKPGPHLRTLLAHEFTHAVIFSEHVFGCYLPELPKQDEESWLNEALAHLNEDLHGHSWSNLDYRISAFLSQPERYHLVVPDYYAAGLWRSHGHRGATYLFLRWCADRHGATLPSRLIQTNQCGLANLETATRERFSDLFRRWSAALALAGTGLATPGLTPLKRLDAHQPLEGRLLCGPRWHGLSLAGRKEEVQLAGTATVYLLLHTPGGYHTRLTIAGPPRATLQASLVRLPEQTARLSLCCRPAASPGAVHLDLTAHDADVTLTAAAWERRVPSANRLEDTSYRPDQPIDAAVRCWFGDPILRAGETRTSPAIPLPSFEGPNTAVVFKVAATDVAGRRVTAWAVTEPMTQGRMQQAN